MKILKNIRNYIFYCGIEKNEYKVLKKDAYVSNFEVWRVLHCMMVVVFAVLFFCSMSIRIMSANQLFYLLAFIYSAIAAILCLVILRKDSIIAQLLIYLSISLLFLFACMITQNKPDSPATTFIVFLLITPMFMIDKPYFMAIELITASIIYLTWMRNVKPHDIWELDAGNIIVFTVIGLFLHIIANSIRIKEFVLLRKIALQKDTDELTGIKNKGAVTREINSFLEDNSKDKAILFMMDIDHFKSINDTYGHDIGDSVIRQFGIFLRDSFPDGEIVGRFGGDEFILFIKDINDESAARNAAEKIIGGATRSILLPDKARKVSVSIGISLYHGVETNYSELFKKADVALYKTKADRTVQYNFYK